MRGPAHSWVMASLLLFACCGVGLADTVHNLPFTTTWTTAGVGTLTLTGDSGGLQGTNSSGILGPVILSGGSYDPSTRTLTVSAVTAGTATDRSITTVAATSMTLFPANASRRFLAYQIPLTATSGCWINQVGGAAAPNGTGSFFRGAGYEYESAGFVTSGAITIYCAQGGIVVPATEG